MLNIAEGFDSGSNTEFVRFLRYAQRSCTEIQSALYIALDQNYVTSAQFQNIFEAAQLVRSKIGAFIKYLMAYERRNKTARAACPNPTKNFPNQELP